MRAFTKVHAAEPSTGRSALVATRPLALGSLWLLIATSSVVFVEPAPYDILGLGLFLGLFALGLRIPPGVGLPLALLGIYLLANVVAAIGTPDPGDTIKPLSIRVFLAAGWLLFVCLVYQNPKQVLSVIWSGYLVAAAVTVAFGLVGYSGLISAVSQIAFDHGRVQGTFKDANVFGPFLVPAALYLVARIERGAGLRRGLYAVFFLVVLLSLLLSYSRGAWLDFILAVGLYMLLRLLTTRSLRYKARLIAFACALTGVAVLAISWAVLNTKAGELFFERAVIAQKYDVDPNSGRLTAQRNALRESLARPLGVGPSHSARLLSIPPHNVYLHVLIEAGWLGAAAFWGFLLLTLRRGWQMCLRSTAIQTDCMIVFACLVGVLFQSLFIDSTHWRHLFLLLGMMWGAILACRPRFATL